MSKNLYAQTRVQRAAFLFYANGSHPFWAPTGMGEAFVLTPHMAPMEAIRKDIVICRNMTLERGRRQLAQEHLLLGAGRGRAANSFDQVLADHANTPVRSLEISIGTRPAAAAVIPGELSQRATAFLNGARNPVTAYSRIAERIVGGVAAAPGQPPR